MVLTRPSPGLEERVKGSQALQELVKWLPPDLFRTCLTRVRATHGKFWKTIVANSTQHAEREGTGYMCPAAQPIDILPHGPARSPVLACPALVCHD